MRKAMMLVLAALAGCGDGGEPTRTKSIRVTGTSDFETRLKAASDFDRGMSLRRAVLDSGARCKKPDRSGYQQAYNNLSMWTLRCSDGGEYALFIAPNADVQVRKCADAKQLQLPECRLQGAPATPAAPAAR